MVNVDLDIQDYHDMVLYLKSYCKSKDKTLVEELKRIELNMNNIKSPSFSSESAGGYSIGTDSRYNKLIQQKEEIIERMQSIEDLINTLDNSKQAIILWEYFILGYTHEQIADAHVEEKGYSLRNINTNYKKGILKLLDNWKKVHQSNN